MKDPIVAGIVAGVALAAGLIAGQCKAMRALGGPAEYGRLLAEHRESTGKEKS